MRGLGSLRRSIRVGLFLSQLVAAVAVSQATLATDVHAAAEKVKIAVGAFDGAKSGETRSAFIDALKKDGSYEVTDAEDIKASAKGKAIAEAAKGLAVDVVITGKLSKAGLKLKVLGADGKLLDEAEIKGAGGKLKGNVAKGAVAAVADGVGKVAPKKEEAKPAEEEAKPAEEESTGDEEKKEEEVSASTDDLAGAKGGLSPFDATAGLRPLHRTFEFNQTIADVRPNDGFGQFLKYELPLGPVLFIDLNWFPASHFTTGPAEYIGLTGGFEKGFATQSVYQEGTPNEQALKTNLQQFYIGPRFRLPIGPHMLGATGTFGQHTFALDGDTAHPLVPDVKYSYIKAGLDGTFRFGDFSIGARVGKRFVMSTGTLKTVWFPSVKTQSLEAGATVGYRLVSMLELVAGFDWLRYAFDFNPVPRRGGLESYVAGGAVDEYLSGYIAFRFHIPGESEKAAASQ
jgi:hypothetical protein